MSVENPGGRPRPVEDDQAEMEELRAAYQAILEERELLRRVVDSSADATILVELSGSIIEWNPAAERLFGWKRGEILGRPLTTLIPRIARRQGEEILERERTGEIVTALVPRLRKDGSVFEAELTASGVFDPEGRPIGYVGAYRDVTERVLIEAATSAVASDLDPVAALTNFASVLREVIPFAQVSLNVIEGSHYRRLVSVGSQPEAFSVDERVPVEGNSVKQAIDTLSPVIVDDTTVGRFPFDQHLARSGVGSYVIVPLIQDGRAFATFSIGFDEPGVPADKVVQMLNSVASGVVQGVKNILLYEQQRETVERLRALDEMKNNFLQAVSHDLRTPLTAVLGLALTLEQRDEAFSEEERSEILRMIATNARKLERLVADLLDLDRLTRGVLKPYFRRADVGMVARNVAVEVDLEGRPLELDCDAVEAVVDAPKVERIVENLLVNAMRHTPSGTRVWLSVTETRKGILIVVEDDGPGVAEDAKEAIFELFQQGPGGSPGTGVGLALVARFADLHGGRAWVEDRRGGGASFRVLLPHRREQD